VLSSIAAARRLRPSRGVEHRGVNVGRLQLRACSRRALYAPARALARSSGGRARRIGAAHTCSQRACGTASACRRRVPHWRPLAPRRQRPRLASAHLWHGATCNAPHKQRTPLAADARCAATATPATLQGMAVEGETTVAVLSAARAGARPGGDQRWWWRRLRWRRLCPQGAAVGSGGGVDKSMVAAAARWIGGGAAVWVWSAAREAQTAAAATVGVAVATTAEAAVAMAATARRQAGEEGGGASDGGGGRSGGGGGGGDG